MKKEFSFFLILWLLSYQGESNKEKKIPALAVMTDETRDPRIRKDDRRELKKIPGLRPGMTKIDALGQ